MKPTPSSGGDLPNSGTGLENGFETPTPLSMVPLTDPVARRAGRLLSMVHELHKAGYQRLRICAGYSPNDAEWRCHLLTTNHMRGDGWTPVSTQTAHEYSSANASRYFGWDDAQTDDARRLAAKFIDRFPETAQAAAGHDWAYAGWFTLILGRAENGRLPAFYGGLDFEPPAPATPLPPGLDTPERADDGEAEPKIIAHEDLTLADLPPRNASYERLWPFCLSFDGYRGGLRSVEDCQSIASLTERTGLKNATLERLRTTAFIRQRAIKWGDPWPPSENLLSAIRDVVEEMRQRLDPALDRPKKLT